MPTLLLHFASRRYHATPWGHHVNEGLIEWPPSPWRLLRALIATGYAKLRWHGETPPPIACSLVEKLASVLPHYRLPSATGAHSRHYMPLGKVEEGRESTTLVFDTWAQVDSAALAVTWNVALSDEECRMLSELAERIGYLGRAESWVQARLAQRDEPLPDGEDCVPCISQHPPGTDWEQVPLMVPLSSVRYAEWRRAALGPRLEGLPTAGGSKTRLTAEVKRTLKVGLDLEEAYPGNLIDCLQVRTDWLRRYGWSQPPGAERVFYWRRTNALEVGAPGMGRRAALALPVEAMLLSMATAGGNDHALPPVTRTLPQAEMLHRALVRAACQCSSIPSKVLTGRDEMGNPLTEPHRHAHLLPLDLDDDGHLDHILVWAPMRLDGLAQAAVRSIRKTFTKGGVEPIRLALAASGRLADIQDLPAPFGDNLQRLIRLPLGAVTWESVTPFVPPRYVKRRGKNTLEGQICAELLARGMPSVAEVRILDPREDSRSLRLRHFVRSRRAGPPPPADLSYSVSLTFERPVTGPLCIGYGCHFGLGVFRATG